MPTKPSNSQQPKQQSDAPDDSNLPPPPYTESAVSSPGEDLEGSPAAPHQPHYRTIVIEHADIAPILSPIDIERQFPVAALFFIFGWLCPPLWIIGACCCMGSQQRYEAFWGNACLIMALVASLTSIVYSSVAFANKGASG